MTLLVNQATTGLEEIQREALIVLMDHLNDAIADVEAYWSPRDIEMAERRGVEYVPTLLERVDSANFHEGHRPSLIKAPIDAYPAVCAICLRSTPAAGSELLDQMDVYTNSLYVEMMVKSSADEQECNRRVQRMATAVNLCMMANQTLNGIVSGLNTAPTAIISDLFTRKERTAYGTEWFWQGARNEYAVRKEAAQPASNTGFFRPAASKYDIDQA